MKDQKDEKLSEYDECLNAFKSDPFDAGKLISQKRAKEILDDYFKLWTTPSPKKHIYGHTFGLEMFRDLMIKIEENNRDSSKPEIRGIRIYQGVSARNGNPQKMRDLILMPVTADNCDLIYINPRLEHCNDEGKRKRGDDIIGGESRPCPNQCKKK